MRFDRARMLEAVRLAARALQLALCATALVTMTAKFFVVAFVVVAACSGMLVAVVDGFPHWFFARPGHANSSSSEDASSQSRLSLLLTKHCPYSKRQTVDMLLALLLLAAAVAFLASDTMDRVCDVPASSSTVEKAANAAESAIDSLGLGGGSESSSSSGDSDGSISVGCAVVKASVGCALVAALLFLVTIALTCPPFAQRSESLEDGARGTEADSRKPNSDDRDGLDEDHGDEYRRLDGDSPRPEATPTRE